MHILVTGGAGYIGSHTGVSLLEKGYEVVVVDNLVNSKKAAIDRIEEITGKQVAFYEVDILDKEALDEVFGRHTIDAVIHFAGLKAVGESVAKPLTYYYNNVTGTMRLLEVMKKHDVKSIVFSSSATVYGMENPSPLTEDMPLSAINPYGMSKLMIERILEDVAKAEKGWHVANLRYFNPVGAHESGLIGEDPKDIPNNLMPYITQVAVGKQEELRVFGDDYDTHDGTGVRDYIHVVDLAEGHIQALEKLSGIEGADAFNLGTGTPYSVLDMVKAFEKENDVEIPYTVTERRAGDLAVCYADTKKAKRELDFSTEKTLADMVRDSYRFQKRNPEGY